MTKSARLVLTLAAALATPVAAAGPDFKAECKRVASVYPLLMIAAMAEGPMDCGDPHSGSDPVDCAAGETPVEKAAHDRRFQIRTYQEAAYKKADRACTAWAAARKSPDLQAALQAALTEARAADSWRPGQ